MTRVCALPAHPNAEQIPAHAEAVADVLIAGVAVDKKALDWIRLDGQALN